MENEKILKNAEIINWLLASEQEVVLGLIIQLYSDSLELCLFGQDNKTAITYQFLIDNFGKTNAQCASVMLAPEAIKTIGAVLVAGSEDVKASHRYSDASAFIKKYLNGELRQQVNEIMANAPRYEFSIKALKLVGLKYTGMHIEYKEEDEAVVENVENNDAESKTDETDDKAVDAAGDTQINPKADKDLFKAIEAKFGTEVTNAMKIVESVYTGLFASGYGVIEPEGLMCDGTVGGAFLYLTTEDENGAKTGVSHAALDETSYLDDTYTLMSSAMGIKESKSRVISYEQICDGYNYFPYKLLEFAFGRYASSEEDIASGTYKKHSNAKMWRSKNENNKEGYLDAVIVKHLKQDMFNVVYACVKAMANNGILMTDRDGFQQVKVEVQNILGRVVKAYCPCIIVSENSDGRFKIRISDIDAKLTHGRSPRLGMAVREQVKAKLLDIIGGTMEKDVDPVSCVQLRQDGSILEFEVVKNSKLCGAVPLFAYKALDKLKEQGETVSWDNIILGRAEDDSVYTGNNGTTKVNFNGNTTLMHISAGSRSGKGVMTLNILASAIASGIPVFYLDSKPDMAALIRRMVPNFETFAINGGLYDGKADDMKIFAPNSPLVSIWNKNLPAYLNGVNLGGMESWSAAQYFKALDFCIYLMSKIGKGDLQTYGVDPGTDDMVVVVDELWRFLGTFSPLLNKLKSMRPSESKITNGTATELQVYAKKFTDWQHEAITSWRGAKNATLAGTKPCIILIYQELATKTSKTKYGADILDDGPNGNSSVYRALLELGTEALVGYNKTQPHELIKTEKGRKFLTYANRYFAYVPNIEEQLASDAEYFKPFLILNDAIEDPNNDKNYIGQMKKQMKDAGLNVDKVLSQHRAGDGQLRGEIGFENYIKGMGGNAAATLHKSFDIAQMVLDKMGYFRESGNSTVFEYLFDMRPEYLLTWEQMNNALLTGSIAGGQEGGSDIQYEFGTGSEFFGEEEQVTNDNIDESIGMEPVEVGNNFSNEYADINPNQRFNSKPEITNQRVVADRQHELEMEKAVSSMNNTEYDEDESYDFDAEETIDEASTAGYDDEGLEVSGNEDFDLEQEMNRPVHARNMTTATNIDRNNSRRFIVTGSENNRASILNKNNSIDCTYTGVSPFMERIYEKTNGGVQKYRKKIWNNILSEITNKRDGISKMKVAIISLKNDCMFVNRKFINLSGIVGGDTGISLSNIVSFKSLIKAFPGIIELDVDAEMFNVATMEYDTDTPEYNIFNDAKTLMQFNLTDGAKTVSIGNRADILRNRRSEAIAETKQRLAVGNEISAMCMADKEAKIVNNNNAGKTPTGLNQKVWLCNATKTTFGKAKNNLVNSKKSRPVRAMLWGTAGLICGVGSLIFGAISGISKRRRK